ncbi:MAG: AmmeMemoRadiSam system radical SAM enzyme [Kiritimatiellae bacterium]|nr:AmmeMemoRadiSam system radical SAM enzyme [Kiritimatiellia bacterium]
MKNRLTRRQFLGRCACGGLGAALGAALPCPAFAQDRRAARWAAAGDLREAFFWEPAGDGRTRCLTCPNECVCPEGGVTACRTRINLGGRLYSMTYGRPCVVFQDALEKNPLYHVTPGQEALGIGTAGCNLRCLYCQNWEFAQCGPWETRNMSLSPEGLVDRAASRGLKWITFSYTEPVAYLEYALDIARLAVRRGLRCAVVTGGFIHAKPLAALLECGAAFSVTLKGADEKFYRDVVACPRDSVWQTIRAIAQSGRWIEVVNLIVPTMNDRPEGIRAIARSLAGLSPDIPLHFLRFAPAYKLKHLPPTPRETLEQAREAAIKEGLHYVYLANLPGHEGASTLCPSCRRVLVERVGFKVLRNDIRGGRCPGCQVRLPGLDLG